MKKISLIDGNSNVKNKINSKSEAIKKIEKNSMQIKLNNAIVLKSSSIFIT